MGAWLGPAAEPTCGLCTEPGVLFSMHSSFELRARSQWCQSGVAPLPAWWSKDSALTPMEGASDILAHSAKGRGLHSGAPRASVWKGPRAGVEGGGRSLWLGQVSIL